MTPAPCQFTVTKTCPAVTNPWKRLEPKWKGGRAGEKERPKERSFTVKEVVGMKKKSTSYWQMYALTSPAEIVVVPGLQKTSHWSPLLCSS